MMSKLQLQFVWNLFMYSNTPNFHKTIVLLSTCNNGKHNLGTFCFAVRYHKIRVSYLQILMSPMPIPYSTIRFSLNILPCPKHRTTHNGLLHIIMQTIVQNSRHLIDFTCNGITVNFLTQGIGSVIEHLRLCLTRHKLLKYWLNASEKTLN